MESFEATNTNQEFYIPTESSSIHFLKSKLCVGCARGFEVVSVETLETQSLLDQADTSLDFVARKENIKPIHIERLNGEFLLNYTDFSFFVNRNGWRARPDWKITWEGNPQSFALSYPYILAFEPSFIEIRHVETSALVHILTAKNIRMLHSSTREVCLPEASVPIETATDNLPRFSTHTKTKAERILSRVLTFGAGLSNRPRGRRWTFSSRERICPVYLYFQTLHAYSSIDHLSSNVACNFHQIFHLNAQLYSHVRVLRCIPLLAEPRGRRLVGSCVCLSVWFSRPMFLRRWLSVVDDSFLGGRLCTLLCVLYISHVSCSIC